ncbi:unnamed protein product [Adineta steineri]|uniref:Uncharacterized protein n=2 Tax=Adineta steineri TaxID=433720 RepID=A0A813TI91_9BILA|nr:unnamed protein product [Adineta steineri]
MATDDDDFEIIDEIGLSNEPVFEFIDVNDTKEKDVNNDTPKSPDVVLPLLVSKPLINEIPQIVQQQISIPIVKSPEPQESNSPIKTTIIRTPFVQIKKTVPYTPPPPRIFAPVPPLPKSPPHQRYGDAARIPYNGNEGVDINTIINTTRKFQQDILNKAAQEQQDAKTISDTMSSGSAFSNVLKAKEDLHKSAEQLEREKRAILSERIPTLKLDGKTKQDLIDTAKEFHELLEQLHGAIYELSERFERQKYDMIELSERARQIEKGKAKTRKSNIVHTGLGGGIFTGVNDITAQAPPKVSLFSRYERVTDRRTYTDRRDVWSVEKKSSDFVAERPKAKIKQVAPSPDDNSVRKTKSAARKQQSEDKSEDLPPPPPPVEEEPEEEAPAPEEPAPEEPAAEEEPTPAEEPPAEEEE